MQYLKNTYFAIKETFKDWKYVFIAILTTFIFHLISSILFQIQYVNLGNILHPATIFWGFYHFSSQVIFFTSIIISVLTGILFSMLYYRFENIKKFSKSKIGVISSIAMFLGIAAPGCASCGVGLAVALGLGSSISKLPFQGIEISFIAILLLIYSISKISNSFYNCNIKN